MSSRAALSLLVERLRSIIQCIRALAGSFAGTLDLLQNITDAWSSLIRSCELMYVANVSTWLSMWRVLWLCYVCYLASQRHNPIACYATVGC
jgi:hypothetical protein